MTFVDRRHGVWTSYLQQRIHCESFGVFGRVVLVFGSATTGAIPSDGDALFAEHVDEPVRKMHISHKMARTTGYRSYRESHYIYT